MLMLPEACINIPISDAYICGSSSEVAAVSSAMPGREPEVCILSLLVKEVLSSLISSNSPAESSLSRSR